MKLTKPTILAALAMLCLPCIAVTALAEKTKDAPSIQRTIDVTQRSRRFPALTVHRNTSIQKAPAPVLAELSEKELRRAKVTRCWLNMDEMWDYRTREYTFNYKIGVPKYKGIKEKHGETWGGVVKTELRFDDDYLKPFGQHSDEMMLCIRRYERDVLDGKLGVTMDDWRAMFKAAVKHSKEVCPNLRYIEVCNEYALRGFIGCNDKEYYKFYKRGYQAVNEVNKELNLTGKDKLLVGGPAATGNVVKKVGLFLKNYAADSSPEKKLDFLSWHEYHNHYKFTANREAQFNKMCEENDLPTGLPMFITEHDPFHGKTGQTELNLRNSACLVKSLYFTDLHSPSVKIMPWVLYHNKKAQTRFMWFTGPNKPDTKAEEIKMQPAGCSMKFLAMHKDWEIDTENDMNGKEMILASVQNDGLIVQAVNYANPRDVQLKLDNLPKVFSALKNGKVRVRKYLIDQEHSNCITKPDYPGGIEMIQETQVPLKDGSITLTHQGLAQYGSLLWELIPPQKGVELTPPVSR